MEMPSLEVDRRIHEFHFGASTLHAEVLDAGREDLRTRWQRILFQKPAVVKASWDVQDTVSVFRCPGGALAEGVLWTNPVEVPSASKRVMSAYFSVQEKRTIGGPRGRQSVVAHLREAPVVGPAADVASESLVLHAADAPTDPAWHAHTLDLASLVAKAEGRKLYLTVEMVAAANEPAGARGVTELAFQRPAVAIDVRHPNAR